MDAGLILTRIVVFWGDPFTPFLFMRNVCGNSYLLFFLVKLILEFFNLLFFLMIDEVWSPQRPGPDNRQAQPLGEVRDEAGNL